MADDKTTEQVKRDYEAFLKVLPTLARTHPGKFALMRDGNVVDSFDTARDAYVAGSRLYQADMLFSIQEVVETPVNLGVHSYALEAQ